ncbi:Na+/H+ antiporter NhaC [Siminovitchia sediminis]|uniref:Na+/H+ antiporter NhaC n=1 Tax=Siminovitchia sediminis TaxID=1274353 RepID=A0ABW4KDQ1_9BACI
MSTQQEHTEKRKPTLLVALIPIGFMIIALFTGIFIYESDPHIPLLLSAGVAAVVAISLGYKWKEIEEGMLDAVRLALQAIVILMVIGAIIGSWIAGGVVPTMIYYGLEILSPGYFLVAACAICCIVAIASGNSWTAAGTIGIAIMGIGHGLGMNPAMVAGAVISGVYFGDKISPLSETTNLAPGIVGVELFEHIKHMLYTTIPALVIALIIYAVMGMKFAGQGAEISEVQLLQSQLADIFTISPWLLIVPGFIIVMMVFKIPALPGLTIGAFLGTMCAIVVQNVPLGDAINILYYGYSIDTGVEVVDSLLNNGGIESVLYTVSLIVIAMCFGGVLERAGFFEAIVRGIMKLAKSTGSLIATTVGTSISANIIGCDQYLSIIVPGRMYAAEYERRGLKAKNLSRVLEDAGTMTSPLVPWNTCGAFMAATLGVATLSYLPFAFLCLLSPIISIIYGFTGFKIEYKDEVAAQAQSKAKHHAAG